MRIRTYGHLVIPAADSEKPYFRVRVRLPTGSAVAMNSVTTAYSTERARLLRGGDAGTG